jgi:GT2 family glycosyltransferase
VSVSIVVATLDRPDDLRECLTHLTAQRTTRAIDIVVVDNNPASGLTPPVVAGFPRVRLVSEPRRGLAYARNCGFLASRGEIAVATDDDVIAPPEWLETLLTPFARADVMVATGNILAWQVETEAQRLFEAYGGLGRGTERREADADWFRKWRSAVPTWTLGATANAAFRSSIFRHPQIGLMDEALGPGTPTGVGEDTYLFYKVLKAGYTIVYEPAAWVWHKHRRDLPSLRKQLFDYSKGHVAYHLTTLLRDGDWRSLINLLVLLPGTHVARTVRWLLGRSQYPPSLVTLEAAGNVAGAWALWKSRERVRRDGRSSDRTGVNEAAR